MTITRKSFLTHGAVAAGALLLSRAADAAEAKPAAAASAKPAEAPMMPPPPSAIHFPVLKPAEWELKKMTEVLKVKKEHKVVFESIEPLTIVPGLSSLYIHVQNWLNAADYSMGWAKNSSAATSVVIGPSVVLALNDAMWAKYKIGETLKLMDGAGKPETANVYWKAQTPMGIEGDPGAGGNIFQDWSGEACVKRGVTFFLCHNALTAMAGRFAGVVKANPPDVLADWKANLNPGFMLVPAGVIALQAAMEAGWKSITVV